MLRMAQLSYETFLIFLLAMTAKLKEKKWFCYLQISTTVQLMMSKHFSLRPQLRKTLKTCRRRFAVRIYNHRRSDQINVAYSEMRIKLLKNGNHSQKNSTVICHQARNQLGQTKPYVSKLGSYQCCTLKIEISDCNEFGFFGQFLDVYRKIFLTSLTSDNFP